MAVLKQRYSYFLNFVNALNGLINKMNWQEIIVGIIVLGAVAYLIRYFIRMSKSHKCDECSLMDMKKESDKRKAKQV